MRAYDILVILRNSRKPYAMTDDILLIVSNFVTCEMLAMRDL